MIKVENRAISVRKLKMFGKIAFYYCGYKDGFWFRIFNYGLSVKPFNPKTLLWSERNGHRKYHVLFGRKIVFLTPSR